ncbi:MULTISPECIES: PIG-L deacetylase family protein [Acidithrix]|uniref:Mycothiol S-conjugate amidase n=1 Tax=Acidithrix ferrooxidans TaxID=1280514 RepID=A0A0D8HHT3_9ACTN|nr:MULTISPECIES: PIG-L deacetylase family protein [Acidithrix]KJF17478.1 mycothiol S-conjugate amidase [Acidithrix ferrooxidans]CAG4929538.1 unnamed protein product [Acidithrix sp. C25]
MESSSFKAVEIQAPKVVLVVAAHPDDADFGAGGTIAKWIQSGIEIHYCLATSGEAGGFDRTIDRSEIPGIRQLEQTRAGDVYGVSSIEFLGFIDGEVEPSLELRKGISRAIRRVRPDTVICQSPERNYERMPASHPDHLATGEAALRAIYPDSRNPFAFPQLIDEGFEPHSVSQILMMASPRSNFAVDITGTFELKLKALHEHKSQLPTPEKLADMLGQWGSRSALYAGLEDGKLAELFYVASF